MGTVNYKNSNYITIGFDLSKDYGLEETKNNFIEESYESVRTLINKYDFKYINITVIWGYYEGFSLYIDEIDFDEANEDLEEYKNDLKNFNKFLIECVNDIGLVVVTPNWCTSYYSKSANLEKIENVINELLKLS